MKPIFDVESGLAPGLWRFPTDHNHCSIYRAPASMRDRCPEAYTPELVIIGPLHHNLKLKALNSVPDTELVGYVNTEKHKRHYLAAFSRRLDGDGEATIDGFRRIIEENEELIRNNYSELTTWINSLDFVNMILYDSVFILEFLLRTDSLDRTRKTGDLLIENTCLRNTIIYDLKKLENQLPYFILERLFDPFFPKILPGETLRGLIIYYFSFGGPIRNNIEFSHFTDLLRSARVQTLPACHREGEFEQPIEHISNAAKLDAGGVKFKVVGENMSINVNFNKGCLEIPRFVIDGQTKTILLNIMAFEQCHYPFNAHICNYIIFLDYLIDTEKDVEFLVEKGIIRDFGDHAYAAETVNNLNSGTIGSVSHYSKIASDVEAYYNKPSTKRRSFLKRVYFSNIWTGTATVAATLLLLMTFIGTAASVIQAVKLFV